MPDEHSKLRFGIAGNWTADDFSNLFSEVETLHELAHFSLTRIHGQTTLPFRLGRRRRYRFEGYWYDAELDSEIEENIEQIEVRSFLREVSSYSGSIKVSEIRFASPGFTDFVGIGKVIAEIRKFSLGVLDRYLAKEDRELAREHTRQTILKEKLANAERFLRFANKAELDSETRNIILRRALASDYYLESNILEGKITEITELDEE